MGQLVVRHVMGVGIYKMMRKLVVMGNMVVMVNV